jgi:hypothetical protein
MSYPLLSMKKIKEMNDGAQAFYDSMEKFKKPKKKILKAKIKTKPLKIKTKKKPAKKKDKPIADPPRPSPFSVGEEVWVLRSREYVKATILKCIKPGDGFKEWHYVSDKEAYEVPESSLYPAKIFTLIANDVSKMKTSSLASELNNTFDAKAIILEVYRTGQKKPWAYYVIPDPELLYKYVTWKYSQFGFDSDYSAYLYVRPTKNISLRLTPISSAPQEILTYLGLHIYNRKWIKDKEE